MEWVAVVVVVGLLTGLGIVTDHAIINSTYMGFPTRIGQWAREPRPYDYGQFHINVNTP